MNLIEIFLIAFALSMDAFSVSFGIGCKYNTKRHYFRLGWHFGLFQFLMPLIGFLIGSFINQYTDKINIISALILFYIAYKMIKESLSSEELSCKRADPTKGFSLIYLSIATSLDALGVGFTFVLFKGSILLASIIIGITCGILSLIGVYFGSLSKKLIGSKMEIIGAMVLIAIGLKFIING